MTRKRNAGTRNQKKKIRRENSLTYERCEPRQLLAADAFPAISATGDFPGDSQQEALIRDYLGTYQETSHLQDGSYDLELVEIKHGIASTVTRFQQTFHGTPVFNTWVTVAQGPDGQIQQIHDQAYGSLQLPEKMPFTVETMDIAELAARDEAGVKETWAPTTGDMVWYADADGQVVRAWQMTVFGFRPAGDFLTIVDADTNKVIHQENRAAFWTGSGEVYVPNPWQTQGNGVSIADNDDANNFALEANLISVQVENLVDGQSRLIGTWADVASLNSPEIADVDADEPLGFFEYTRDDDRFEQVNVYYHLDRMQQYLHDLGYDDDAGTPNGIRDYTTIANARWFEDDQSFFSPGGNSLHFGIGGVDNGEDGDIIGHEYGHAIQHDQNAVFAVGGFELDAIGEGFSDFWAVSYFINNGAARYQNDHGAAVGEWDASSYSPADPPNLRRVDGNKMYPDDLTGMAHQDGEIWSRALWDIMNAIGRDAANEVILESHFSLPAGATMPIAAEAVLLADVNLNGGANTAEIRQAFVDRGILSEIPDAGVVNFDRDNYTIPDTIEIVVTDGNAVEPVEVTVESTSGDSETVMLTELAEFFYGGNILTAEGAATPGDGTLQTAIGDTLTVTYNDPDNGLGAPQIATDTAIVTNTRFYPSDDVPVTINDNTLHESIIDITDVGYVGDLNVELDITHTWDADLDVFLVSPSGTTVELFSDVGGDGDNFSGTVLDDEATQSILDGTAPFTGSFTPEGNLGDFDNEIITGIWTLQIFDDAAGDTGSLNNWSLTIDVLPATAGQVNFDMPFYNVGDTVGFQVIDSNTDGSAELTLTSGGDTESITLLGVDIFNGNIPTAVGNPVPDDGILQVSSGVPITVEYADTDDGSGNPATDSDTAGIRNVIEFPSADVPVTIDDNTTVTSDLEITDDGIIGDIDVLVDITHTWDSDLDVTLISPGGERVDLFLAVGGSGDNFTQTILDDEATTSITAGSAPFTGRFTPVGNLTGLELQIMTGTWQLEITDNATGDTGTLNEWSLFIDVIPPERGQVSFDAAFYESGDTVGFSVFDTNTDGTAEVVLTSSDGDSETVVLNGGGPDFSGTMATADAAPVAGDGILQVAAGGSISIQYMDIDDGSGNPATAEDTADIRNTIEYPSVAVPITINDNTTFTSEIVIADTGLARDVDVLLDITHTWDADLDVFLIAPDGDRVELFQDVGADGDNFTQTILDDEAEDSITSGTAPFTGRFKPVGDLSLLEGELITGTWLLEITDDAGGDTGTLNEWSLFIDVVPVPDPDIVITAAADVTEGNTGTTIATFDVMLSEASSQTVTVDYATTTAGFANPASAGADFVALMDTLTFDPGETMKTIEVEILGEERIELDEQFGIELSNASGGTVVGATAQGTILDDDVFIMGTKMDVVTQDSPIESGLIGLTDTEYSVTKEIGWQPGAVNLTLVDTGIGGDLERDVVRLESGRLTARVPIGFYRVQVTYGDPEFARDMMQVTTEGRVRNPVNTEAGETKVLNYRFAVVDGFLDLDFEDVGGSDDTVSIAAIQIVKRLTRDFRPNPLAVPTTKGGNGVPVGPTGDPHNYVFSTRDLPALQTAFDYFELVDSAEKRIEDRGVIEESIRAQLLSDYLEESLLDEL